MNENIRRVWTANAAKKWWIKEELKTVRLTIKMQMEGLEKLDERKRELEVELDAIWEEEDQAWEMDREAVAQ